MCLKVCSLVHHLWYSDDDRCADENEQGVPSSDLGLTLGLERRLLLPTMSPASKTQFHQPTEIPSELQVLLQQQV